MEDYDEIQRERIDSALTMIGDMFVNRPDPPWFGEITRSTGVFGVANANRRGGSGYVGHADPESYRALIHLGLVVEEPGSQSLPSAVFHVTPRGKERYREITGRQI